MFVFCAMLASSLIAYTTSDVSDQALLTAYGQIVEGAQSLELYPSTGPALSAKDVAQAVEKRNIMCIDEALSFLSSIRTLSLQETVEMVSGLFLGRPCTPVSSLFYDWDRKGFDMRSVRFDAFDGLSFLETVLALSLVKYQVTHDVTGMQRSLFKACPEEMVVGQLGRLMFAPHYGISPLVGAPSVLTRHLFFDGEWAQSNRWLLKSVTKEIYQEHPEEIHILAEGEEVQAPYTAKQLTKYGVLSRRVYAASGHITNEDERDDFLSFYNHRTQDLGVITALARYIPLANIIDDYSHYISAIDEPMVMMVIADKPALRDECGSHSNVIHVGFVFPREGGVTFRHADMHEKKVVRDIDLMTYAKQCLRKNKSFDKILGFGFMALRKQA